jgi:hypothetical protein
MFEGPSTGAWIGFFAVCGMIVIGAWELLKFLVSHLSLAWQ